jgi:hypothetical protein
MGYAIVENFAGGVDRTRPIYASNQGTLWAGINGHMTRGGDFEKRKAFTQYATIPNELTQSDWLTLADPIGNPTQSQVFIQRYIGAVADGNGIIAYLNTNLTNMTPPTGVRYQLIRHPTAVFDPTITTPKARRIVSYDLFDGKIYASIEFDDGTVIPYYDGVVVYDAVDGIDFVGTESFYGTAGGFLAKTLNAAMARETLAGTLPKNSANANYAFTSSSEQTEAGTGRKFAILTLPNIEAGTGVDVRVTRTLADGSGEEQIAIAQGATTSLNFDVFYDVDANGIPLRTYRYNVAFTLLPAGATLNIGFRAKPSGNGDFVKTYKRKMYTIVDSLLNFSGVDDPTKLDRDDDAGAGFINMSNQAAGSEILTSVAAYQDKLAIFARNVVQIWFMDANADNNRQTQILNDTGTRAGRSVVSYGDLDVFYLADTGVRSIRARDTTNSASINDVGTPIDTLVQEFLATITETQIERAVAVVEPTDGRYLLAVGNRIFVFSYFPSKRISAWSYYDLSFNVDDFFKIGNRIYVRSGNIIYLLGGVNNNTYGNDYAVTAQLPFLSASKEATYKQIKGVDILATGTWDYQLLTDPRNLNFKVNCGILDGFTPMQLNTAAIGHFTHVAPLLTHQGDGYASISKVIVHFDGSNDE